MSNDGQRQEEPTTDRAGAQLILEACSKAVEDYRGGTIGKAQALLTITTQLVSLEAQQSGAAEDSGTIQSYLDMLADQINGEEPDNGAAGTPGAFLSSERSRSREPSEDADEPRPKRSRVDPGRYAWASTDFLLETRLHPHIARTLELIRLYGEDLTQAKRDISASPSAPEFPESEWTNVLTGRAVDLDHVFAGHYTPGAEDKTTERIGELEFTYRTPVSAKRVSCFGDWVFAWKRASVATTFAFPHRREELDAYGEQITGLFGALAPSVHSRVLDFDRAVRKRVGSVRRSLLTDVGDFADLKLQYIDACGANVFRAEASSNSGGSGGAGRRGAGTNSRKKEACRKFNSERGCHNLANECRFRHACAVCGAEKHNQLECFKNARRDA
ncbi:hypothetical protein BC628DRAFT_1467740 [Trametes gibbosa]|nr:hypothetical protein BC628DRAFT_1467740 [Trametes gibbosa]